MHAGANKARLLGKKDVVTGTAVEWRVCHVPIDFSRGQTGQVTCSVCALG